MEEKELFEDYEFKNWELTPRFYKIVGLAVVIQFSFFAVMAQFNLLQTRACDNPLTGKVCEVLDAIYISSTFLDNKEWRDGEYVSEKFKDAEIAYVDMTNVEPPFTYPEGYFALVNPDELAPETLGTEDPLSELAKNDPAKIDSPIGDLIAKKQELPKINKNPVKGDIPDSPFDFGDPKTTTTPSPKVSGGKVKGPKNDSPQKLPKLDGKDTVAAKDEKKEDAASEGKSEDEILNFQPNKKPLEDLRESVKEKLAKNEVDLKAPFLVTIDGYLTKEGKLDPAKTRFTEAQGDQKMIDVAKSAIEAINDSGLLTYLDKLGGKRIVATLQQDKDKITIVIKSAIETEEKAKTLASGFKLLISTGKILRKGKDEETLLKAATVKNEGKVFILNFDVPQQIAQELIQKQLTDAPPEVKVTPSSLGEPKNTNSKAGQ